MVEKDPPTPDFSEGQAAGSEINSRSGRRYTFEGLYLANDGTIVYRATLESVDGMLCGELSGTFDHGPDEPDPPAQRKEGSFVLVLRDCATEITALQATTRGNCQPSRLLVGFGVSRFNNSVWSRPRYGLRTSVELTHFQPAIRT